MAVRNDINAQTKSDLVNFNSAIDGQGYLLLGESVMGDRSARIYYYDINSVATVDGDSVLATTGMGGVGRFIKLQTEEIQPDWNASSGYGQIFNKPSLSGKRQETYSGTTNSSGNYVVTFGTSYSVAPNVQASITGGSNTQILKITSVSTTGFTINVVNRTDVVGLLPSFSNVSGAPVDVLITEK